MTGRLMYICAMAGIGLLMGLMGYHPVTWQFWAMFGCGCLAFVAGAHTGRNWQSKS